MTYSFIATRPRIEPTNALSQVRRPNRYATESPAVLYGLVTRNSKAKKRGKVKIVICVNAHQGTSKWSANFLLKGQRSRSPDVKNPHSNLTSCLLTSGGASAGGSGADCKLGLTILDRIYCQRLRRSATGLTAAYHIGTRHRHLFLFIKILQRIV